MPYLRTLVPKIIQGMVFGTRSLKYLAPGLSGKDLKNPSLLGPEDRNLAVPGADLIFLGPLEEEAVRSFYLEGTPNPPTLYYPQMVLAYALNALGSPLQRL